MTTSMICPKCMGGMRAYERNGVTVEQCTDCRGLFLDRGELEHLLEAEARFSADQREAPVPSSAPPSHDERPRYDEGPRYDQGPRYDDRPRYGDRDDRRHDSRGYDPRYSKKRKRSFLEDLFD